MKNVLSVVLVLILSGCASARPAPVVASSEDEKAVTAVMGAISGKEIGREELRNLARDMKNDPETQQAVQAITSAVSTSPGMTKYCPVDGARFGPTVAVCPEHNAELKPIED